ncbi:DUF6297 family protein [Nonomuraea thailandensis]
MADRCDGHAAGAGGGGGDRAAPYGAGHRGERSLPALTAAVSGAAVVSCLLVRQAWRSLERIPTRTLVTSSTRAGHVAGAAMSLDPGALTWISEDNHWRARKLASRRWPPLPAPFALAWQDWRRLARRRGRLLGVTATAALPAVLAQAGGSPAALGMAVLGARWPWRPSARQERAGTPTTPLWPGSPG